MSTYLKPGQKNSGNFEDCPPILVEFLNYSESIQGLSPRTVNAYYMDLRTFFRFLLLHRGVVLEEKIGFDQIDIKSITLDFIKKTNKAEIYEYTYYLTRERDNTANTRARKLSSLKSFFRYLTSKTGQMEQNPVIDVEMPKIKKRLPKYLSLEESRELLESIQSDFYARDYCIITLFLNCGMRLSELVGMNRNDIKNDTLRIIGKGNKERTVYLNAACQEALQNLIGELKGIQGVKDDNALFISHRTKKRLTARRIQQIVNNCLHAAGLDGKGYSVHKLRHTAATLMYQYGHVDMLALKEILGHEDLSTTQIYTHLESVQLKDAADASPLSQHKSNKKDVKKSENHDKIVENNVEDVENP
ncbi:tyrosine recombinase XerC [Ruminococcaceae bacterium OttesenSCG-928-I18]|nr:tyrosine recombinase XerC [Ruminococcaceae bacterium OttesenSCG-928-I18]